MIKCILGQWNLEQYVPGNLNKFGKFGHFCFFLFVWHCFGIGIQDSTVFSLEINVEEQTAWPFELSKHYFALWGFRGIKQIKTKTKEIIIDCLSLHKKSWLSSIKIERVIKYFVFFQ